MKILKLNNSDNVAVAIRALQKADVVRIGNLEIVVLSDIPAGHKIAISDIAKNDYVIKYGYSIGITQKEIAKGEHVNENNMKTTLSGIEEYNYNPDLINLDIPNKNISFNGYVRSNGKVGIRNEIWIVPTVGCINGTANFLAKKLLEETGGKNIDAIVPFTHNYGCSQLGDDFENTRKILKDIVLHPNAGGVLVIGLGCENNQITAFRETLGLFDQTRIKFLETQKSNDEIADGMKLLMDLYNIASKDSREKTAFSNLQIGLKCGGSDGFSGITANPLVGRFSDFHTSQGGTTVLTEVPEMFGAEKILMNRCQNEEVFDKTVLLINNFKKYFIENKQEIYENPSPGNKAGGISTLEEKSLGCTQKSGQSAVNDVIDYGDIVHKQGLNLLNSPGNDMVASTALAASGCQIVLFTTGRGTPYGTFVPTIKISSNTDIYNKKKSWIDFNAGTILADESFEDATDRLTKYILQVANGEKVNNELNGFKEIAIFKSGVTL